ALLEDVQRQQQTREQHRPEREQGQPRHARSLGRRRGDGHARFAGVGATVIRACLGEVEAYVWCLLTWRDRGAAFSMITKDRVVSAAEIFRDHGKVGVASREAPSSCVRKALVPTLWT